MLHALSSNESVSVLFDRYQREFYSYVTKQGNLPQSVVEGYGCCIAYRADDGIFPSVYRSDTEKDYSYLTHDDTKAATYFFGMGETRSGNINCQASAHLICVFKLDLITFPSGVVSHMANEEALLFMQKFTRINRYGFRPTSVVTGAERVFAEYDGFRRSDMFKTIDKYPYYCVRQDFNIIYKPNQTY